MAVYASSSLNIDSISHDYTFYPSFLREFLTHLWWNGSGQCSSHGAPMRDGLSESRLMDLLHGSEYVLTYEDKDGDWMLVGDVPWE